VRLLFGIVLLLVITAAILIVTTIAISAIIRGHDRGRHGTSGSLGSAMLEMQSLLEPGKKQVLEARRQLEESEDDDESGDPPLR
jgi:hypothetical protein